MSGLALPHMSITDHSSCQLLLRYRFGANPITCDAFSLPLQTSASLSPLLVATNDAQLSCSGVPTL